MPILKLHKHTFFAYCILIVSLRLQHLYYQTQIEGALIAIAVCILGLFAVLKPSKASFWYLAVFFVISLINHGFSISLQLENDGIFYGWNWLGLLGLVLVVVSFGLLLFNRGVRDIYLNNANKHNNQSQGDAKNARLL